MSYLIDYTQRARRDLSKIKAYYKRPIQSAIAKFTSNPYPKKSIDLSREYEGLGVRRLSVDDWRIIYEVDEIDKIVLIRYVRLKTGPETYDEIYID